MNNININDYIDSLGLSDKIDLNDIPEIDLYMDQVMQLFESKLSKTKRTDNDKVLTKTMINNYAKGNLLMKIKNKKYSKDHIILMSLIYSLKGSLSLNDIKATLTPIVSSFEKKEDYPLRDVYESFLNMYDANLENFKISSNQIHKNVSNLVEDEATSFGEYEEKLLLICSYISMSNMYRRISEKIIDDCFNNMKENK